MKLIKSVSCLSTTLKQYFSTSRTGIRLGLAGLTIAVAVALISHDRRPSNAQGNGSPGFVLLVDGAVQPGITAFENNDVESEIVEYDDGKGNLRTRPGRGKPITITVTKDWSNTSEWYTWRKTVLNGKVERKSISVIFHDDRGERRTVNFFECWPCRYTGPELNAKSSGHATEKIELSVEHWEAK